MKKSTILIGLVAITFSCGEGTESTENRETESTIDSVAIDSSDVEMVEELYEMHPEVVFEIPDYEEVVEANLGYFEGKLLGDQIILQIEQSNWGEDADAVLFYHDREKAYELNGKWFGSDSIALSSNDNGTVVNGKITDGVFKGSIENNGELNEVSLNSKTSSPEQIQHFINLNKLHSVWQDEYGVYISKPRNGGEQYYFNDFITKSVYGEGYDFSQAWETNHCMITFYDEKVLLTEVRVSSEEGTEWVEGKEPNGIDDQDAEASGTTYNSDAHISWTVIEDGIKTKETIDLEPEDKLHRALVFKDHILIVVDTYQPDVKFKIIKHFVWDNNTNTYKEV